MNNDLLTIMESTIRDFIKDKTALKPVDKEKLIEYIDLEIKTLNTFAIAMQSFLDSDRKVLANRIASAPASATNIGLSIYKQIKAGLRGEAQRLENQLCLESLCRTTQVYNDLLNEIKSNITGLFENKIINLYNTKLSHVVLFSVLREAELVANFNSFLLNALTYDLTKEIEAPGMFRSNYLQTNANTVTTIVNDVLAKNGAAAYLDSIKELKQRSGDTLLVNQNDQSNVQFVDPSTMSGNTRGSLAGGFFFFNIFKVLGEAWNNLKHYYYSSIESRKTWMEAHVALLRMDLNQNAPKDSKDFLQMRDVINRYDAMISADMAKIQAYYNQ